MADVFISYHEESAGELAEQIADALDAAGISAWCARRDMALGGNFAREIPNQIHDCRLFLLILNDNVYHSEHIENEVGIAFNRVNKKENILILPLELGDFTRKDWVEYYLIHTQGVKLPAKPDEKRIQRLIKQIAKALNRETQPAPIPQSTPEPPPVEIVKRGECGDNVTFTLDEKGVLMISGNGPMRNSRWNDQTKSRDTPWWNEREIVSHVEIKNGVTVIGAGAFFECVNLLSATIPYSVTRIENGTFFQCIRLTSVTIPDSVIRIGGRAFFNCMALTSVTIPNGVKKIEWDTFAGCRKLESVIIPDSVTEIEQSAFASCTKLTNVSVPPRVKIGVGVFPPNVRITRRE